MPIAAEVRALEMGAHGARQVRRWEAGEVEPSGPARVAIRLMLRAAELEAEIGKR